MKHFTLFFSLFVASVIGHAQQLVPEATAGFLSNSSENNGAQKQFQMPVNLSTGVPQVSVPLGSISSTDMALSFALSYDASGRRPDELAGWTGWGWSLVGGGQITRVIKGEQDEQEACVTASFAGEEEGSPLNVWNWNQQTIDDKTPYVTEIPGHATGYVDEGDWSKESRKYQPDEYYFNFNGRSGSFVINQEGMPVFMPYQELKIDFQPCLRWFEIIDEQGYVYLFALPTESWSGTGWVDPNVRAATTWYLTSIKDVHGNTLFSFTYSDPKSQRNENVVSTYVKYTGSSDCAAGTSSFFREYYTIAHFREIQTVTSNTGQSIHFIAQNDRLDITGRKSLDKVEAFSSPNVLQSRTALKYSYFLNENGGSERLKLIEAGAENGSNEYQLIQRYEYNETIPVFSDERRVGKDHWGYYNGLNLSSISDIYIQGGRRRVDPAYNQVGILTRVTDGKGAITLLEYETNTYSTSPSGNVASLPPLGNLTVSSSLTIDTEEYFDYQESPPGGWTWSYPWFQNFDFPDEHCGVGYTFAHSAGGSFHNDLPEPGSDGIFNPEDETDIDHPNNAGNEDPIELEMAIVPSAKSKSSIEVFTVDVAQTISIQGEISKSVCSSSPHLIRLRDLNNQMQIIWEITGSSTANTVVSEQVQLPVGTYRLECIGNYPLFEEVAPDYAPINWQPEDVLVWASFTVTPLAIPQPSGFARYAGGLRIKKVTVDDGDSDQSNNMVQRFEYSVFNNTNKAISSGYLFSDPIYEVETEDAYEQFLNTSFSCIGWLEFCFECDRTTHISSGVNSLISSDGSFVVYSNVRMEYCDANGVCNQGWTDNYFSVEPSTNAHPLIQESAPYPSWRTGLNLETRVYHENGSLISQVVNEYDQPLEMATAHGKRTGVRKTKSISNLFGLCGEWSDNCGKEVTYHIEAYTYRSELIRLRSSESRVFNIEVAGSQYETTNEVTYESFSSLLPSMNVSVSGDPVFPIRGSHVRYAGDIEPGNGTGTDAMALAVAALHDDAYGLHNPVEVLQVAGSSLASLFVTGGQISTFRIENGEVVADATYSLELAQPVPLDQFAHCHISADQFVMHPAYRKIGYVETYDSENRPIAVHQEDGRTKTIVRDYPDGRPVAEVVNASANEVAYTSFETESPSGWSYNALNVLSQSVQLHGLDMAHAFTGTRAFRSGGSSLSASVPPGSYLLSFWGTAEPVQITMNGQFLLPIVNAEATDALGWAYFEYRFSSSTTASVSLTLPTNEWLDELRLYPADAMMTTIAYNEDGTVRTQCDENNRVTTYLYDAWRRVQWTLDDQREILTFKEYHIRHIDNAADLNWTKTKVVLEEGMDRMSVESAPSNSTQVHIGVEYVDGLGRPLQTIAVRQSPMMRDIVSFHQYDSFGRELKQYLPFTRPFNDGEYIPDAIARQSTFYQNTQHVAQTDFPFAEVEVEPSPLGRITRKASPGESWSLSDGFTVSSKTVFNGTNDVLCWRKTSTGWSAMVNGAPSYYPAGALAGELTINEHGNRVWVFTNSAGQLVCTRLEALMSGSGADLYTWTHGNGGFGNIQYPGNSAPSERFIDSYAVYDEFGRTSAEIPAIAVFSCGSTLTIETSAGGINESIFSGYLTAYEYDARGRVTRKKEPGCDYSEYVYNRLNQVVLSRSPELNEDGTRWNFVKYDALGRPIQTGFYSTSLTRQALQSQMDGSTAPLWEMKNGQMQAFYSNLSFPVLNPVSELHTETYYDDYMFDVGDYEYNSIEIPEVKQTWRMRGNITGSRVMVLDGTGTNYLLSVHYSDLNGRPAVDFTSFITGGFEKQTTTYDFTGKVDRVTHYLKRDANTDALTWENWFTYDSAGRLRQTWQKTEGDQNVMLSRLQFNELGQVVKKHLHQTAETDIGMQVVDYRYNERGWLTHINNADLVDDGDNLEYWDAFGEELIYADAERYNSSLLAIHKRFDGNIAGIKWKTNSALDDPLASSQMGGHSYVFRYDDFNQMTAAFYAASADQFIDNYSYRPNTWDEKVNYGLNGRILHINRKRGTDMQGNPLAQFAVMDNLSYSYVNHSNQLLQIKDQQGMVGWTSSFSHFVDLHPDGPDYAYDQEGRMTLDKNKGLTFEYNHLDLVAKAIQGTNEVQFIWDATGNKLAKVSPEGTTYYLGMAEYDDTELLHIATSEGLVRNSNGDWVYDYYLKDHLGNVRVVLTEENSTIVEEKVTVELERRYIEDATFENVSPTEKDKPYLYPYDPYDPDNAKVSELTAQTGKIIGPAKMIQVVAGERIDLRTQYWYTEEAGDPLTTLSEIIAGTLLNMTAASIGVMPSGTEQGMGLLNNVTSSQFNQFNTFMNQAFDGVDLSKPQAYMVYLLFKDDMTLDYAQSGVIQVGEANQLGTLSQTGIIAKKEGFFYVYVTNRSEGRVNFDNLKISRWQPQVRVAYDYYPFGLTWHNPAAADTPEGRHDHAYQDKEFQWNEFGAGAGMALYDFHARMYDPATATWSVPDPAEQFANPYLAMGNNPVVGVDPDGRFVLSAIIVGTLVGSYVGAALAAGADNNVGFDANPFDGSWKGTDWYKGAVVGGFAGAGAGLGLSFIAVGASAASSSSVAIGAAYKGIIGSNMGIVSNALSGGGLDGMFSGALIGAAAGFTSGMLASTSFASKAASVLRMDKSELSVGIYNVIYGMSDGTVKSMAQDEPWYDVALSAMLGGVDGVVSTLVMSASNSLPGSIAQHASMMATGFRGLGISLPETVIYGLTSVVASPTRLWGFRSGQELGNWWYGRASVAYDRELSILQIEDLIKLLLNENSN